jgi:hypothetical protein
VADDRRLITRSAAEIDRRRARIMPMASPVHRPPLWARAGFAALGAAVLLFNAMLMLSDRAPGLMRRIGGDFVRRLFARIDAGDRASQVLNDPRIPESDAIVHIAVWALAIGLVGLAVWSWRGLVLGAAAVFAASLVVEAAQGRWSDTRAVEASDVRANAAGIVLGTIAVGLCYVAYSALSGIFRLTWRRGYPTA